MPHRVIDQRTKRGRDGSAKTSMNFEAAAQMAKLARAGGLVGVGSHGEMQGIGYHWELWMLASGGMTRSKCCDAQPVNRAKDYRQTLPTVGSIENWQSWQTW